MIGLGAMGQGIATSLVRSGYVVHAFDVVEKAVDRFVSKASGGTASKATSPADAVDGAQVVVLMVQNAAQADDVLFGAGNGAEALLPGAVVILHSTVPPSYVKKLEEKLAGLGKGVKLLDCPVSGGVVRAENGTLTVSLDVKHFEAQASLTTQVICSGETDAISKATKVLLAVTGSPKNLCHVQGGVGAASSVKLINQLLAGVHIAVAAEAMALAARMDLDTRALFDMLKDAAAWSWMFENRVPQMLDADWTAHSALAIFVKDLGIVLDEAKGVMYSTPLSAVARNMYVAGAARGLMFEADAGVVRLYELVTGVSVAAQAGEPKKPAMVSVAQTSQPKETPVDLRPEIHPLPAQQTLASLPAEHPYDVLPSIQAVVNAREVPILVILDDDPTGTQTCHDIDVLMTWDAHSLDSQLGLDPRGFFILTNSRSLPSAEARRLILEICTNVKLAAERAGKAVEIVLRGDSTLRGHLPEEPEAAEEAFGAFDGWVLAPFFFQGGRFTIDDVHYVMEGDVLTPASQTPFAKDATFGYNNSNLREYILEKCGSRFVGSSFVSVNLKDIRVGGPTGVTQRLLSAPTGSKTVIIVNAAAESDMNVFVAGLLAAEKQGRRYLFRTGAAFVSSRLGIRGIPPLRLQDVGVEQSDGQQPGGLIVAGSYVPKTTTQLRVLRERRGEKLSVIELDVPSLIASPEAAEATILQAATDVSKTISAGHDTLVMTSRALITGSDALGSLTIGSKVAHALVRLVEEIRVRPRYVIAKGGITSSDTATKGLRMRKARVLGQAAPGVPFWRCDEETSRHRGVPYVVFPGNVGGEGTLADVVEGWALRS